MTDSEVTNNNCWGSLVGVIGGAALGYWAGRSSNNGPFGYNGAWGGYTNAVPVANGYCNANGGFNSFEAGKTQAELTAGLNYTGQAIAATRQDIAGLGASMAASFQRLEDRQYQAVLAENSALRGELNTARSLCPIQNELTALTGTVNCMSRAFMPGYVRSVDLCPNAS